MRKRILGSAGVAEVGGDAVDGGGDGAVEVGGVFACTFAAGEPI